MPNTRGSFKTGEKSSRQQRRHRAARDRKIRRHIAEMERDCRWYKNGPISGRIVIARPQQIIPAVLASKAGRKLDAETALLVRAVGSILMQCSSVPPGSEGFRCVSCETRFGPDVVPEAVLVVLPLRAGKKLLATGVCASCARRSDEDLLRGQGRTLQGIWPGLHVTIADCERPVYR